MNRTNSVEPVFSQPLQVTYHQLLQNKTKIEDELYQTQRQLRRKEGEYQKKIAVYEQKIDQMQEQLEDYHEREDNLRSMYEKILTALNQQIQESSNSNKNMIQQIDLERVQDLLSQLQKSHQNSPTHSERSLNSSFRRGRTNKFSESMIQQQQQHQEQLKEENEKMKKQIEQLELSLGQSSEQNLKLKSQLTTKEKDNITLKIDIDRLKDQIDALKQENNQKLNLKESERETVISETEKRVKSQVCKQIDDYQQQFMIEREKLLAQIDSLEQQVSKSKSQQHQLIAQQQQHQERQQSKELQEVKANYDKAKKDLDIVIRDKEIIGKEKDLLVLQLKDQDQQLSKLKKQQTINNNSNIIQQHQQQQLQSSAQNDQIKQAKKRVVEMERELKDKNEEILRLNFKIQDMSLSKHSNQLSIIQERKQNSNAPSVSQSLSNLHSIKNINVGSKDFQVLVDIQTTGAAIGKKKLNLVNNRNQTKRNNNQQNNKNNNNTQRGNTQQQLFQQVNGSKNGQKMEDQESREQKKSQNPIFPQQNAKLSRNSNGVAHSSMANPQTFQPNQENEKNRTHTPMQERHFVDLEQESPEPSQMSHEKSHNNTSQLLSSNHKRNMLDSSLNSGAKSNQYIPRYINNSNDDGTCAGIHRNLKPIENFLSRSNSHSYYLGDTSQIDQNQFSTDQHKSNYQQSQNQHHLLSNNQSRRFNPNSQAQVCNQNNQHTQLRHGSAAPIIDRFYSESERAILSSIEIENVVRKMLDHVNHQERQFNANMEGQVTDIKNGNNVLSPTSNCNYMQMTPSQNVSFTLKKNLMDQSKYSSQNSKTGQSGFFSVDKEFLTKLESSLRKLAKSNEKIKQIMKEKELFELQCLKLKQKIKALKEERNNWLVERDQLIQANHKMDCKLKQAQVILNLEAEIQNPSSYMQNNNNNTTTIYDMSHNSSQKTLVRHFGQRDISPGAQSNLTLNIIQDSTSNNERYKNPPMSCRVNDSYDISLRMNPDNSYGASTRKPFFQNTLDRSLLDQSLITIKRELSNQQQQQNYLQNNPAIQVSQFAANNKPQGQQFSNKFLPAQSTQSNVSQLFTNSLNQSQYQQPQLKNQTSLNSSTFRGKTPTLQINLSQTPLNEGGVYSIGISTGTQNNNEQLENMTTSQNLNMTTYQQHHEYQLQQSTLGRHSHEDQNSVQTSRNFKMVLNEGQANRNQQQVSSSQQTQRQLFKYQTNRSPQARDLQAINHTINNTLSQIVSGQNTIQKPNLNSEKQNLNYSSNAVDQSNMNQSQLNRKRSPLPPFHNNQKGKQDNLNLSQNNLVFSPTNNLSQTNSFLLNQQNLNTQMNQTQVQPPLSSSKIQNLGSSNTLNSFRQSSSAQQIPTLQSNLRRMNSGKAKDRYYTNKRGSQQVQSLGRVAIVTERHKYLNMHTETNVPATTTNLQGQLNNQMISFDEDEHYQIEEQQQQQTFDQEQLQSKDTLALSMTMGRQNSKLQAINGISNSKLLMSQTSQDNNLLISSTFENKRLMQTHESCTGFIQQQQLNLNHKFNEEELLEEEDMVDTDENDSNCLGQLTTITQHSDKSNGSTQRNQSQKALANLTNRISSTQIDNRKLSRSQYNQQSDNYAQFQKKSQKHLNNQNQYQQYYQNEQHQQQYQLNNNNNNHNPSDERSDEEESVQYRMLNNSTFIPSMHSRYANEDNQQ